MEILIGEPILQAIVAFPIALIGCYLMAKLAELGGY